MIKRRGERNVTAPVQTPQQPPLGPHRSWVWRVVWPFLFLVFLPATAWGGYLLGKQSVSADFWDILWLRAYYDRPLDSSPPGDGFWVTGWYVDYDRHSLETVKTRVQHMDQIIIFGYGFAMDGTVQGQDQMLIRAVTGPQKRILLFANLVNGAFNRDLAHAILTDPIVQARTIAGIIHKSEQLAVAGVQIDFEEIPSTDRDAYTDFLRLLRDELHARNMTLSIAAAAKTRDTRTGWGGATDYAAIGQIVDHFYIMTYDEHWRGGEPGPVASLEWVERVIRYATGVMPSQKVVMGVPWYGYEWTADPTMGKKTNRAYSSSQMARRAEQFDAQVTWDPVVGENVMLFRNEDGDRIAWFPDERSLEAKLRLAYQYNLKGIGIWRFGFEPEDWWNDLGAFRLYPSK